MNSTTGTSALNSIIPFQFKKTEIRTVKKDGDTIWFVAKDVAIALNISWSSATLRPIPDDWKGMMNLITPSGNQNITVISEPAVYKLAFRSNKPEAEEFTNWVASEVLPAIHKSGSYDIYQNFRDVWEDTPFQYDIFQDISSQKQQKGNLTHTFALNDNVLKLHPKLPKYIEVLNSAATIDTNLCHDVSNRLAEYIGNNQNTNSAGQPPKPKTPGESEQKPFLLKSRVFPKHKRLSMIADQLVKYLKSSSKKRTERLSAICKKLLELNPENKKERLYQADLAKLFKVSRKTIYLDLQPLISNRLVASYRGYIPKDNFFLLIDYLSTLPSGHKHCELMAKLF